MWAHPRKSPLRLPAVPVVLGAAYGLVVAAGGAIRALQAVVGEAVLPAVAHVGAPWWQSALQSLVWALGGALDLVVALVARRGRCALRGGFPDVVLVLTGVLGGAAAAIGGLGSALLRGAARRLRRRCSGPGSCSSRCRSRSRAASVGAVVWLYHRRIAAERSPGTGGAARLVEAGLGLVAAATGVGVVVNALLAAISDAARRL